MAEEDQEQDSKVNRPIPDLPNRFLPFVEVICKGSGKTRRFAAGTEAGFAVSLINRKVEVGPMASHIEAGKEGEEPVSFGPNSVLVDYGDGWKLQTATVVEGLRKREFNGPATLHYDSPRGLMGVTTGHQLFIRWEDTARFYFNFCDGCSFDISFGESSESNLVYQLVHVKIV